MAGKFRLIFRGEVLEGQHRAVVRRRLGEALKLDDARLKKLFSGDMVVLKRSVDEKTAARYQTVFQQAGALLHLENEAGSADAAGTAEAAAAGREGSGGEATAEAPSPANGYPAANPEIDAPDFTVLTSYFPAPEEPQAEIDAPAYGLAEPGADLSEDVPARPVVVVDVDFELAETGVTLLEAFRETPMPELGPLNFEVAELGADIGPPSGPVQASVPDISHLSLLEA